MDIGEGWSTVAAGSGGQLPRPTPAVNSGATQVQFARTPAGTADMIGGVDRAADPQS